MFVACATSASAQQLAPRIADFPATIEADRITFYFAEPWDPMYPPNIPVDGYFVWRIMVDALQPFSVVITTDTSLRTNKPVEVLKASTVRLCADPLAGSARACHAPINAKIEIGNDHFRLVIRDTVLLRRALQERPAYYWRYIIEAGGRYDLSQQPFTYPAAKRK